MTDPRTLPAPFDRVVAVLELAANAARGHVAYDTSLRARKTGDVLDVDAVVYLTTGSGEELGLVTFVPGEEPVGVEAVDAAAAQLRATGARGAAIVSASGFGRPARHRADDEGVSLVLAGERETTGLPSWLATAAFQSESFRWRVQNVGLPPIRGLPKNLVGAKFSPRDELFQNPQGRRFTPEELMRRWMKVPANEQTFRAQIPRDGKPVTRPVPLRFDRPMKFLANTVQPLPPISGAEFTLEAAIDTRTVPLSLVELPARPLPGEPLCAYASGVLPGAEGMPTTRLWLWLEHGDEAGSEPHLRVEALPEDAPAPTEAEASETGSEPTEPGQ